MARVWGGRECQEEFTAQGKSKIKLIKSVFTHLLHKSWVGRPNNLLWNVIVFGNLGASVKTRTEGSILLFSPLCHFFQHCLASQLKRNKIVGFTLCQIEMMKNRVARGCGLW